LAPINESYSTPGPVSTWMGDRNTISALNGLVR